MAAIFPESPQLGALLCGHIFPTVPRNSQNSGYSGIHRHSLAVPTLSCSLRAGRAPLRSCRSRRVGMHHFRNLDPKLVSSCEETQEVVSSGLPIRGTKEGRKTYSCPSLCKRRQLKMWKPGHGWVLGIWCSEAEKERQAHLRPSTPASTQWYSRQQPGTGSCSQ